MSNHSNRAFWGHPPVCVCVCVRDFYACSRCCKWSRLTEHRSARKAPRASAVRLRDLLPALMKNKRTNKTESEGQLSSSIHSLLSASALLALKENHPETKANKRALRGVKREQEASVSAVQRPRLPVELWPVHASLPVCVMWGYHLNTVTRTHHRTK